jgi:hypothetical protein
MLCAIRPSWWPPPIPRHPVATQLRRSLTFEVTDCVQPQARIKLGVLFCGDSRRIVIKYCCRSSLPAVVPKLLRFAHFDERLSCENAAAEVILIRKLVDQELSSAERPPMLNIVPQQFRPEQVSFGSFRPIGAISGMSALPQLRATSTTRPPGASRFGRDLSQARAQERQAAAMAASAPESPLPGPKADRQRLFKPQPSSRPGRRKRHARTLRTARARSCRKMAAAASE